MTNAEAWFNIALSPRKPEGSLGRTAQDGHLDSHTAPELWGKMRSIEVMYLVFTGMPGESYSGRSGSLLLCSCDVSRALIDDFRK